MDPKDAPSGDSGGRPGVSATAAAHRFGWRAGLLLGLGVLIAVYAVAEVTAILPPLRDAVEHLPVTIAVLVLGTIAILGAIAIKPLRR